MAYQTPPVGKKSVWLWIAGVFLVFVLITMLARLVLPNASIDLTQDNLYTLSDGTRKILANLEEPVTLRFFYSEQLGQQVPAYSSYANRVKDLLREYARAADGKLQVTFYNPVSFSQEEDLALAAGLQGATLNAMGDKVYFGMIATNTLDAREVMPFFQIEREQFLEYDLTKLIYSLANPQRPKLGVISSQRINGDPTAIYRTGRSEDPLVIVQQMQQLFDVEFLDAGFPQISDEMKLLLLVQPDRLSKVAVYAIDQFLMRGGNVLVFADPVAESDRNQSQLLLDEEENSSFAMMLDHWGVTISKGQFVADYAYARRVSADVDGKPVDIDYLAWLSLTQEALAANDQITANVDVVNMASAGSIEVRPDSVLAFTPIMQSSKQAALLDADYVVPIPDAVKLLRDFQSSNRQFTMAARLSGKLTSMFPDGTPADAVEAGMKEDAHLSQSATENNLILIADTDMLRDDFWVQKGQFMGTAVAIPQAGNGALIINALDNLLGSNELISLRGRGITSRPFTVLENLRRRAEEQYRAKEEQLREEIRVIEAKLADLTGSDSQGEQIITPEQQALINDFQGRMLEVRQELRSVQRALREDIEALQARVVFINIMLVPVLVVVAAWIGYRMRQRRRQHYREMAL